MPEQNSFSARRCSVVFSFPGVQTPFNQAISREKPVQQPKPHEFHAKKHRRTRQKPRQIRGRIGEVPAPASRYESFTTLIRAYGAQRESCPVGPEANATEGFTP